MDRDVSRYLNVKGRKRLIRVFCSESSDNRLSDGLVLTLPGFEYCEFRHVSVAALKGH